MGKRWAPISSTRKSSTRKSPLWAAGPSCTRRSGRARFRLEANELAIQVLGGAGYTRDRPVELLYRDSRLNPIHEGTNGIQSIDLLGPQVFGDDADALAHLFERIETAIDAAAGRCESAAHASAHSPVIHRQPHRSPG